jgi:hypothetical protein
MAARNYDLDMAVSRACSLALRRRRTYYVASAEGKDRGPQWRTLSAAEYARARCIPWTVMVTGKGQIVRR